MALLRLWRELQSKQALIPVQQQEVSGCESLFLRVGGFWQQLLWSEPALELVTPTAVGLQLADGQINNFCRLKDAAAA